MRPIPLCRDLAPAALLLLQSCGYIIQGETQSFRVAAMPPQASVVVRDSRGIPVPPEGGSQELGTRYTIQRKPGRITVQATSDGHEPKNKHLYFKSRTALVVLDSIPLGLGLLVDTLAGTWPGSYPDTVRLNLEPIRRITTWAAHYRLALKSVEVTSSAVKPQVRIETPPTDPLSYKFADQFLTLTVTPTESFFEVSIRNDTTVPLYVPWGRSAFVDFDQTSHQLNRSDRFQPASADPQSPSVIVPGTTLTASLFPKNRLFRASTKEIRMSADCIRQCSQITYSCMAANNCSGYKSRDDWPDVSIGEYIGQIAVSGLCERRCINVGTACSSRCGRNVSTDLGLVHLPIAPNMRRPCSEDEADFLERMNQEEPAHFALLIPITAREQSREYLLRFETELNKVDKAEECPIDPVNWATIQLR